MVLLGKLSEMASNVASNVGNVASNVASKASDVAAKASDAVKTMVVSNDEKIKNEAKNSNLNCQQICSSETYKNNKNCMSVCENAKLGQQQQSQFAEILKQS